MLVAAGLLLGLVLVVVQYRSLPRADRTDPTVAESSTSVAEVIRRDLRVGGTLPGTLGFGAPAALPIRATGTVTWLPRTGALVDRGGTLLRLDDRPVSLLLGRVPAYRSLGLAKARPGGASRGSPGAPGPQRLVGPDVLQLEQNLRALGYDGFDVDDEFTAGTATAVRAWQTDLGLPATGRVEFGDVVYLRGPIRVAVDRAALGLELTPTAVQQTSSRLTVSAKADGDNLGWAAPGRRVAVTLANQRVVRAAVVSVGAVEGSGEGGSSATVRLRLLDRVGVGQAGDVLVSYVTAQARAVLAVPVTALVALAEGGYAVQRADGSFVPVEPGLYAEGFVEINGQVAAGTQVRVPR